MELFFHPWSHWRKESDSELDSELDPDPDPLGRGTDPGIWIRTKMSRIPNTEYKKFHPIPHPFRPFPSSAPHTHIGFLPLPLPSPEGVTAPKKLKITRAPFSQRIAHRMSHQNSVVHWQFSKFANIFLLWYLIAKLIFYLLCCWSVTVTKDSQINGSRKNSANCFRYGSFLLRSKSLLSVAHRVFERFLEYASITETG